MSKKMQQIISFTMALLLIVSSVDMPVWAVESSTEETTEDQTTEELGESMESSKQKEEGVEINNPEITETQTQEVSTGNTPITDTGKTITSDTENNTVTETKIEHTTTEEALTETDLQEESETENTENKEVSTETETDSTTEMEKDTAEEAKIELIPKLEIEIGQEENILLDVYPKDLNEEDIIWDSSNWEIAIVENGIVTATDVGEATITAKIRETNIEAECLVIVSDINFETDNFSSYSNTRNTSYYDGYGAAACAREHNNSDINKNYGTGSCPNNWLCAEFVARAAIKGGGLDEQCLSASCTYLRNRLLNGGYCTEYTAQLSNGYLMKNNFSGTIAVGDIVLYKCHKNHSRPFPHAVMFAGWSSDGKMLVYAHNSRKNGEVIQYTKCSVREPNKDSPRCNAPITEARVLHFNGNTASSESVQKLSPIANLDGIEGGRGTITLVGWAIDPDDYAKDVEIHIYVGGNIGTGSLYKVIANNDLRSDIQQRYPSAKENCGFNYTFKVNERGTQEVYVYALDTQGSSLNPLIGHTTITIANPDPVIRIDPDSLQLNVNDTKKLTVSYQISETYKLNCYIADTDIASAEWGTPANSKCDLNIKGLKKGNTTVDVQLWNEAMTTLIYNETVPITVTELSVDFSQDSVETNLNEIKTFEFSFDGSDLYGLECEIGDRSITDLTDWRWDENHNGTISIKGYKQGTTDLTLHIMGINDTILFSKSVPITVIKPSTSFEQSSMEVGINKTKEIDFSFRGANLQEVNLDIADQSIATLEHWEWDENNDGSIRIKGHKKGNTTMTLYIVGADGSRLSSKTIPITVKDSLSGITLNASSKELTVGSSFPLAVSYIPSTAEPEGTVQWTSSNTDVAIVDAHGRVKALTEGSTVITASVDGFSEECRITVVEEQVPVTGIRLNTTNIFIKEGTQYTLTVTYTPSNANTNIPSASDIVWSSQNTQIATVNGGVIKAIRSGSTTITAKYGTYSAACKVTVLENEEESSKSEESSDIHASSEPSSEESSIEKSESDNEKTSESEEKTEAETESTTEKSSESEENTESETESPTEKPSESEEITKSETESTTEKPSESEENAESETESKESTEDKTNNKISIKPISDMVYTGAAIKPDLEVYNGTNKLYLNKDYTISYKNNINVGTAFVTVKGKGNYSDKATTSFNILPKNLSDSDIIAEDLALVANRKVQKKIPTVSYNGKKLKVNKDFTASFGNEDFKEKGTYTVALTGTGNYTGTIQAKIILTDKKNLIKNAKITYQAKQTYTGKEITPSVTVMCSNNLLVSGKDYTVSYVNNINPGKANIVITGKGNYAGTKTAKFTIAKNRTILTEQMVITQPTMAYVKGGCFLKPLVICNGKTLVLGNDYTVSYKNNKSVGLATIQIKGKGTYSGTVEKSFTISPQNINKVSVRVPDIAYNEKTGKYISAPILMDSDGTMLKLNKDYGNITYSINGSKANSQSNPTLGSVITVSLSGMGNYTGTVTTTYQLKKTSFSKAKIACTPKTYTGTVVTLIPSDLHVTLNGTTLNYGEDYDIVKGTYKNNTKKGQGSVVIKGLGEFAGEKTVKFRITAKPIN